MKKLIFERIHGISRISLLSPFQWEASTLLSSNAETAGFLRDTILYFYPECQIFFDTTNPFAVYIPQTKAWGFDGR